MSEWISLFGSYLNSGVHRVEEDIDEVGIRKAAAAHGFAFSIVDLCEVQDKMGILSEIARSLGFPSYFGMNWDALNDCLTDMSWRPASGYVVLLTGLGTIDAGAVEDMRVVIRILESAAEHWRQRGVAFHSILTD